MPTETAGSSDPFASMEDAVSAYVGNDEEKTPVEPDHPTPETTDEEIASDDLDLELADEEGDVQEDEADGSEPESSGGRFVSDDAKVKLDDGTVITVAQLRRNNLFEADYTRKTMAMSEDRKAVESQKAHVQQLEQALLQQRETVAVVANAFMPKPPDPALLDPNSDKFDLVGYSQQKAAYEHTASLVNRLLSEHQ